MADENDNTNDTGSSSDNGANTPVTETEVIKENSGANAETPAPGTLNKDVPETVGGEVHRKPEDGTQDTGTQGSVPSTSADTINRNDPTQNASHDASVTQAGEQVDGTASVESHSVDNGDGSTSTVENNTLSSGEAPSTVASGAAVDNPAPSTDAPASFAADDAAVVEAAAVAAAAPGGTLPVGSTVEVKFSGAHSKSAMVTTGALLKDALKKAGIPHTTHTYRNAAGEELTTETPITGPMTINVATKSRMG